LAGLWTARPGLHLARGALAVLSFSTYYMALAALPMTVGAGLYVAHDAVAQARPPRGVEPGAAPRCGLA
jgi:hypothetical protein